jgi:hypothetical protein
MILEKARVCQSTELTNKPINGINKGQSKTLILQIL